MSQQQVVQDQQDSNGIVKKLRSPDELCELFENEKRKGDLIVVVDLHRAWAGPCVVMRPTYERLLDNLDKPESKVKLVAISSEDLASWLEDGNDGRRTNQQSGFSYDSVDQQKRDKKFHRGLRAVIAPAEIAKIGDFLQSCSNSCKPQTLFFRSQPVEKVEFPVSFVASVHGADSPHVLQTFRTVASQCTF